MITSGYWGNNERGSVSYDNRRLDDGMIKIGLKESFSTKFQDKYFGTLACPDIHDSCFPLWLDNCTKCGLLFGKQHSSAV